jgi:hypothetical protein
VQSFSEALQRKGSGLSGGQSKRIPRLKFLKSQVRTSKNKEKSSFFMGQGMSHAGKQAICSLYDLFIIRQKH